MELIVIAFFFIILFFSFLATLLTPKKEISEEQPKYKLVRIVQKSSPFRIIESEKIKPKYSYFRRQNFMTEREKIFFRKLQSVCGDSLIVFSQVRISSLLNHKVRGQNFRGALSHINQKSVDFLLCDSRNLRPLIAIELDDSTHILSDRQKRDSEVDAIFENAKFPLLHIQNINIENAELKSKILELL
ncbi:MAG: DUF2726 domain-containing protein [bacterium]|nr:DUF2726 domain-containing protein [bacterium]